MIGSMVSQRAQMKRHAIIEPVFLPTILGRDFAYDGCQPVRQRMLQPRDVDILSCEPEIARQHQGRPAIDRNLQLRSRLDRRASDLVEGVEQGLAVEGCGHGIGLMKTPDRKSTRLNSSHVAISYAVFCLKKKIKKSA